MPIPKRPISVVDIANELDVELPLTLRDGMAMDLAGVSGAVGMLDLEEKSGIPPLTLRLQDGRVVVPSALGTIPDSNVVLSIVGTQLRVRGSNLVEVVAWAKLPHYAPNITGYQFYTCGNLTTVPTTIPEWITVMTSMFYDCSVFNSDLSGWDVSNVTNMSEMFSNCRVFNQDLSGWCVSKISSLPSSFDGGASAWTLPRPVWGTCPQPLTLRLQDGRVVVPSALGTIPDSNVVLSIVGTQLHVTGSDLVEVIKWRDMPHYAPTITGYRFYACGNLTTVPTTVPEWITYMGYMFRDCNAFNSDISTWDTSNVTNMTWMFYACRVFNQDLSGWDVSKVTNMAWMFYDSRDFNSDISGWNVSKVTAMSGMFYGCNAFNQDLSGWDVSKVTAMSGMFRNCRVFNQDLSGWDVSKVTNMAWMFDGSRDFNSDISGWNVSNVTSMDGMFRNCRVFNQDLSGWCVSKISSLPSSFDGGASAWTLPRPVWGTCPPRP